MRRITLGKYINRYFQYYLLSQHVILLLSDERRRVWAWLPNESLSTSINKTQVAHLRIVRQHTAGQRDTVWVDNVCSCCSELGTWHWWLTDGLETKTSRRQFTIDRVTAGDEWQATVPILCAAGPLHTQHTTPNWTLTWKYFLLKYLFKRG